MALTLPTPVGSNFMKDFPGQNSTAVDRIDNYAGPCLTSHPLQSYIPVLSAVTTPPVLGTGGSAILRGNFYEIFDQIYLWAEFRYGTGFSAGSGNYTMSLPFNVDSTIGPDIAAGGAVVLGNGFVWDASTLLGRQPVIVSLRTSNQVQFCMRNNSGGASRNVDNSNPITWAIDDGITFAARFKRIP